MVMSPSIKRRRLAAFTSYDTAAVERWQAALGITQDGILPQGTIVYMPGVIRMGTHHSEPGANVGPRADLDSVHHERSVDTTGLEAGLS
jgi:hypothetical protein